MKHSFRIIIGMLLLAIPLCLNAQVVKPNETPQSQTEAERLMKEADRQEAERQKQAQMEKQAEMQKQAEIEKRSSIKPAQNPAQTGQNTTKPHTPVVKPKKPAEKPAAKPEKPEKERPKLDDYIKISGFVQGMYQANLDNDGTLASNTFRMRRVRVSVDGTLFKGLTYKIQGDCVNSPFLVDAYLKYKPCNEFAIQIGQFKTPFSIESPINPVNLEIFDYGEAIQSLVGYSDVCGVGGLGRDIGIMATGDLFPIKGDEGIKYHVVNYSLGVFNGNGPVNFKKNEKGLDNNNRKDIVGRLEVHPGLKALTLSGSYYFGKYKSSENEGARKRWAAGVQYNDGNLVVRGEYLSGITGRQVEAYDNDMPVIDENGDQVYVEELRLSNGYYAVSGYNFNLGKEGKQTLMPVLRYEHFEPGDMDNTVYGSTNYYTVGLNYWPLKSVNFKVDYSLVEQVIGEKTYSHRLVGILSYKF